MYNSLIAHIFRNAGFQVEETDKGVIVSLQNRSVHEHETFHVLDREDLAEAVESTDLFSGGSRRYHQMLLTAN
jgi:hypothetical protein